MDFATLRREQHVPRRWRVRCELKEVIRGDCVIFRTKEHNDGEPKVVAMPAVSQSRRDDKHVPDTKTIGRHTRRDPEPFWTRLVGVGPTTCVSASTPTPQWATPHTPVVSISTAARTRLTRSSRYSNSCGLLYVPVPPMTCTA